MIYYKPEDKFDGVDKYSSLLYYRGYYENEYMFDLMLYSDGYRRELDADVIRSSLKKLRKDNAPWLNEILSQFTTAKEANTYLNKTYGLRGRVTTLYNGDLEWEAYTVQAKRYIGGRFLDVVASKTSSSFFYDEIGSLVLNEDDVTYYILTQDVCDEHPHEMFRIGGQCRLCADRWKIRSYNDNVLKILKKKETRKGLPLGVELEYDTDPTKVKQALQPLEGFAIAKHDGSVKGYEIVSLPATLPEHLSIFKAFLFDKQKTSISTGMHVHIDSKSLSNLVVAKMYAFLYAEENVEHITKVAGRDFAKNHYCKTGKESLLSRFTFTDDGVKREYTADRFTALNNNSKHGTIECRIFASPTTWTEFAYRMQFIQAMVDYCSAVSIQAVKKWDTFVEFVKNSYYKELKGIVCV